MDVVTILTILFVIMVFGYLPQYIAKKTGYYDKKKKNEVKVKNG
jgi:hypothetical protein